MKKKKMNYAVVGLGHIAQVAVLPAFQNSKNSVLQALVSGDQKKLKVLSRKYEVPNTYSYDEFEDCLNRSDIDAVYISLPNHLHRKYEVPNTYSYDEFEDCLNRSDIDAVYISLPNHLHRKYAVKAAEAGKHILCEKPLAVTSRDASEIIRAARHNRVKLMTAYRLHFDPTNLKAIQIARSGKLGEPRYFTSEFGHQVKGSNIRAMPEEGGTPLHDLGIYCINAARYIMRDEPIEVFAVGTSPAPRLPRIEQTVTAILRFPHERVASFVCSFGSAEISNFRVVGDKGDLFIEDVYEYAGEATFHMTVNEKTRVWQSKAGDQFAAELDYFSSCILENKQPEPSGKEGLVDVKIIEALMDSMKTGKSVRLTTPKIHQRPSRKQEIRKAPHREPRLVHAESEARQ